MKQEKFYENYPLWIILVSNLVKLSIYLLGTYLMLQALIALKFGAMWLSLYLILIGWLEFRLLSGHCVNCYYYGKNCAFGSGKLCGMLFKKGTLSNFCKMQITWRDLIPDFLVAIVPMLAGIVMLIKQFDWVIFSCVFVLGLLSFMGNGFVRGSLACKYCKQRKLGCPAEKLFAKKK
jgi:hypothetical protein